MMMLLQRVLRLQPAKQGWAAQLGWAWLYWAMPVRVLNSASISKFCPKAGVITSLHESKITWLFPSR